METAVLEQMIARLAGGKPMVVSILVETVGSSPQEAGAWMALLADASQLGTLGGGCVEAEVRRRALPLLSSGGFRLDRFNMDADYGWDDGLICGGRIAVLSFRTGEDALAALRAWQEGRAAGRPGVACALADGEAARLYYSDAAPPAPLAATVEIEAWRGWLELGLPHFESDGVRHLYVEPQGARERLIIAGAGHVGCALARLAARLDFETTVLDDRADFANRPRFPDAAAILVGPIAATLAEMQLTQRDYVVLVTRGHKHDEEALAAVIEKSPAYLGMIGSRRKVALIFHDLRDMGVSKQRLEEVHAPIGLPIGSRTVEEIATSIAAELVQVRAAMRETKRGRQEATR